MTARPRIRSIPQTLFFERLEANLRTTLLVFFSTVHLTCMYWMGIDLLATGLGFALLMARVNFFNNVRAYRQPAIFLLWCNLEMHFFFSATVTMITMEGRDFFVSNPKFLRFAVTTGTAVLLALSIAQQQFVGLATDKRALWNRRNWPRISPRAFVQIYLCAFVGLFSLSIISLQLGLSQMAGEEVVLPYKMGGIINVLRIYLPPYLAILAFDILYESKDRSTVIWCVGIYAAWLALEMIVRASRGVLVLSIEYLVVWAICRGAINRKAITAAGIVALAVFIAFPIITTYRYARKRGLEATEALTQSVEGFIEPKTHTTDNDLEHQLFVAANRKYTNCLALSKFYHFFQGSLDHFKLAQMQYVGGTARFHTHIIDKVPRGTPHSSGTTGFGDGYLVAGVYGLVVMSLFFFAMAIAIDGQKLGFLTRSPAGIAISIMLLLALMSGGVDAYLIRAVLYRYAFLAGLIVPLYLAERNWGPYRLKRSA